MPDLHTLPEALQHWATHKADHPAFIFRSPQGHRHVQTFEQIYLHGGRYAAVLRAGGTARGHLVANTLPNCPERVVCEAAILMTGAASVNAMCQMADGSDLLRTLRVSRAMAVLLDPDVMRSPWHVLKNYVTLGDDDSAVSEELPHLRKVYFVRRLPHRQDDFLSKLEASSEWYMTHDVRPGDVCSVFTTSGTTGFSKLVVHTYESVVPSIKKPPVSVPDDSVLLSLAPLGWLGGHITNNLLTGDVRVLVDTKNGMPSNMADFLLKCFREENITLTFIPVSLLAVLLERVKSQKEADGHFPDPKKPGRDLQILDIILLGGQPVTRSHVQLASLLARSVVVLYASTECAVISMSQVTDPDNYQDFDVGLVTKNTQVKIVKEEGESTMPAAGNVGNILLKTPGMMKEYLHDPRATANAFTDDGFFRTGDIGYVDERGHLIVGGRGSDAIMKGQYIFYPGWLEERIRACPAVNDVMIVGVPDPALNEEICACVVLESKEVTVQEVQALVETEIVTSDEDLLSPRPRHYLTFDVFPITSTGKAHRKAIKQQAAARLSA